MLTAYGDGTVFGRTFGDSPASVLWLHGWRRSSVDFVMAGDELVRGGVSSIALDLPGFGASPEPTAVMDSRDYADQMAAILESLHTGPLTIVGHSFGGRVAVVLAARHPELVRSLVLTGVPLFRPPSAARPALGYRVVRSLARHHLISERRLDAARERHGSSDYRAARGVMRGVLVATVAEDYSEELTQWRGPTTLVWGVDDTETPLAMARRALEVLGGSATLVELTGVGHLTPTEAPHDLAAAVGNVCR